jgi:hypothetical protein
MSRAALLIDRPDVGQVPTIRQPIPELTVVDLRVLLIPELREWIVVGDESQLNIVDHCFRIVDWQEHGLVIEHRCCYRPANGGPLVPPVW